MIEIIQAIFSAVSLAVITGVATGMILDHITDEDHQIPDMTVWVFSLAWLGPCFWLVT